MISNKINTNIIVNIIAIINTVIYISALTL